MTAQIETPRTSARRGRPVAATTSSIADVIGVGARAAAGPLPKVIGLDLSLTGTGVAGDGWADTITFPKPKKRDDRADYAHRRLNHIRSTITDYLCGVEFAVLEGLSFDSYDTGRQNAGLSWIVRHMLWGRSIPYALVPPSNLKQYATGSGGASKEAVRSAVIGQFPWFDGDDNAADATVLHCMGRDWLGHPVVAAPEAHRAALVKCEWPDLDLSGVAA